MSDEDRQAALDGVHILNAYSVKLGFPETELDFTFYLYRDLQKLLETYQRERRLPFLEAARKEWDNASGRAGADHIFAHVPPHLTTTRESLIKLSAHEMIHVYQVSLSELGGSSDDSIPKDGPVWLTEGVAEFLALRAMSEADVLNYGYDAWRNVVSRSKAKRINHLWVEYWSEYGNPLDYMETRENTDKIRNLLDPNVYSYFLMAAELLAAHSSESALMEFYNSLKRGTTWRKEFENVFGISVEEFYDLFEEHADAGFPEILPTPTSTPTATPTSFAAASTPTATLTATPKP